MAIYLNERILKADPKGTKLEREYAQGLVEVQKLFDKFRKKGQTESHLQLARKISEKDKVYSMTSHKQKRLPTIALPVEVPYYDDEMGATLLRYSSTPPTANANGGVSWATKYIEFREYLGITEKQKDFAWFLLFASNLIKKGVYQLVDVEATYEGTFNDIIVKKDVMDKLKGFDEKFSPEYIIKQLSHSRRPVKVVLLDQHFFAGIGNIYANDALFLSGIHPKTPSNKITLKQAKLIYKFMVEIMQQSILAGGSTAKDNKYIRPDGTSGQNQFFFRVYEKNTKG